MEEISQKLLRLGMILNTPGGVPEIYLYSFYVSSELARQKLHKLVTSFRVIVLILFMAASRYPRHLILSDRKLKSLLNTL